MIGLSPFLFLDEDNVVPVELLNASGGELTSYDASGISISTSLNGAALAPFTPAPGAWVELGNGLYEVTVPAGDLNAEGPYVYRVASNDGLAVPFKGFAQVQHRLDRYDCQGSPQYNEVTLEFTALIRLTKNGQAVPQAGVSTCQIWLKDAVGNVPVNLTNITPNADGVFWIQQSSITLTPSTVYECMVQIVDSNGNVWTSILGALSFN